MIIPTIKLAEFTKVDNDKTTDCFYGIENESDKIEAIEIIKSEMSNYSSFKINCDFRNNTIFGKKQWSYIDNVMIFENKDARDETRLIEAGKNNYECILWMSAEK